MKKRHREKQRNNHPTQKRDHIIAPDGFIPNSVIRAEIKGTSKSQEMPNSLSQLPVNQVSLKRNFVEQKLPQPHSETTSSAATFYWESDPDDERIGPRKNGVFEEPLPENKTTDGVQVIEDSVASVFKALDVLQNDRKESESSEELGIRNQPDGIQVVEEKSRKPEEPVAGKELNQEKDENGNNCGSTSGNHSENIPPTHNGVDVAELWGISNGVVTENDGLKDGKSQPDEDLFDAQETMKSRIDDERYDTGSDTSSSVTLGNDDGKENDAEVLYSATFCLDKLREGEEKWKQASVLSITLKNVSRRNGTPEEHLRVAVEEPDNLEDRRGTCNETIKRQLRLMKKTRTSYEKDSENAARYATTCHVIKVPSLDKWRRGRLLPNNPAMYRMYKKRDEILDSLRMERCH